MNNKIKFTEKKCLILIFIFCLLALAPLLIIGLYDRPSVDDFSYSQLTHNVCLNNGNIFDLLDAAFQTDINFYNHWQGLYSSAFFLSLQPAIFGEKIYSLTPLILLVISYIMMFLGINILNKLYLKYSILFTITSSLFIITFIYLWIPSITQGLFWFNGAINYMPYVFTIFLTFACAQRQFIHQIKTKK